MNTIGRWATKEQAQRDMSISLSGLDRMIRDGQVETRRQGGRVSVLVHGPEVPSDAELLENVRRELVESELAVSELRREVQRLKDDLDSKRREASSARSAASVSEANASLAEASASRARGREATLEGQLREVRQDNTFLMWAFISMSVIAAVIAATILILLLKRHLL